MFRDRRYWKESPKYRWIMRRAEGSAPGDSSLEGASLGREVPPWEDLRVAGIAEVCVHPTSRGLGYVKEILGVAHTVLGRRGGAFL